VAIISSLVSGSVGGWVAGIALQAASYPPTPRHRARIIAARTIGLVSRSSVLIAEIAEQLAA
jgi:hypothetical protein